MKTDDGRLIVIGGASRSGKTAYARKVAGTARRILAWDIEDQWSALPGWVRITDRRDLLRAVQMRGGPLRLAYVAGGDLAQEFDFAAGCCLYASRYVEAMDFVAEELADVTTPAKAPGSWGKLIRRGLKRGSNIYAISQRWAEADKTAVGNASEFVLFRQSSADDIRYLSRKTRVPEADLTGLAPLQYVRFDAATGALERGKLRF